MHLSIYYLPAQGSSESLANQSSDADSSVPKFNNIYQKDAFLIFRFLSISLYSTYLNIIYLSICHTNYFTIIYVCIFYLSNYLTSYLCICLINIQTSCTNACCPNLMIAAIIFTIFLLIDQSINLPISQVAVQAFNEGVARGSPGSKVS